MRSWEHANRQLGHSLIAIIPSLAALGAHSGGPIPAPSCFLPHFKLTPMRPSQDIHSPLATVRESLEFSAALRLPAHLTSAQRSAVVDETLALLELDSLASELPGRKQPLHHCPKRQALNFCVRYEGHRRSCIDRNSDTADGPCCSWRLAAHCACCQTYE